MNVDETKALEIVKQTIKEVSNGSTSLTNLASVNYTYPNIGDFVSQVYNSLDRMINNNSSFESRKQNLERDVQRAKQDLKDREMVWNTEKVGLNGKISDLSNQLSNARSEAGSAKSQLASVQNEIKSLRDDLSKEEDWWTKWINDASHFPNSHLYQVISKGDLRNKVSEAGVYNIAFLFGQIYGEKQREGRKALREIIRRAKGVYG